MMRMRVWGAAPLCAVVMWPGIVVAQNGAPSPVVVTWTGAGGTNRWDNPLNWSPQVVPNNTANTHYGVVIPANRNVAALGLAGAIQLDSLATGPASDLQVYQSMLVQGDTSVAGTVETIVNNVNFTASGSGSSLTPPSGFLRTGGANSTISFGATTYSSAANPVNLSIASADASGSRILFPNLVAVNASFNDNNATQNTVHSINVNSNATLSFASLTTVTGPTQRNDRLFVSVAPQGHLLLPVLDSLSGNSEWQIFAPTSLPAARSIHSAFIQLGQGGTLSAPNLVDMDNCNIMASSGSTFTSVATSYSSRAVRPEAGNSGTTVYLFRAFGAGTVLNLSSIQSIDAQANDGPEFQLGQVIAGSTGGRVDLSGLRTVAGPSLAPRELNLTFDGAGLATPNLERSTGSVRFFIASGATYSLDRLSLANDAMFQAQANVVLRTPALTNMDGSSVTLAEGASYTSVAPAYSARNHPAAAGLFSSGFHAVMDLRSFSTFDDGFDDGSSQQTTHVVSTSGGSINLSGVTRIIAPVRSEDRLRFTAQNGTISFSNLLLPARAEAYFTGGGVISVTGSLVMENGAILNGDSGATPSNTRLMISGDFVSASTRDQDMFMWGYRVVMNGAAQLLEVAGVDLGPVAPNSFARNFAIGVLQIGDATTTSSVRLVDMLDNSASAREALYIHYFSSEFPTSLVIMNNSELIIGDVPVYAKINGSMVSLRSLIPAGSDRVRFDGGWIVIPSASTLSVLAVCSAPMFGRRRAHAKP